MPRVSVILPTYNGLKYLDKAIQSALAQTFQDFELIVVDDGSNDGTAEFLKTIEHDNLRVFSKQNGGAFDAINYGINRSTGELVTWISSDNVCTEYFLDALVAGIDSQPNAKFAYASYFNIDSSGNIGSVNLSNYQLPNEHLTASHRGNAAFIYYKDCHDFVGKYIDIHSCDTDMWIKLVTQFDEKPVYIIEPVYYYRIHNERVTSKLPADYLAKALMRLWDEFEGLYGASGILKKIYPNNLATNNPFNIAMACNDIAIRYANVGLLNHAMVFWESGLVNSDIKALRAIIHNILEAASKFNIQPEKMLNFIRNGVTRNRNITDAHEIHRQTEKKVEDATIHGFCGYISDPNILKLEYSDKFVCFSYLAWKSGECSYAVPHASPV